MCRIEAEHGESIGRLINKVRQECRYNNMEYIVGIFNGIELVIHGDSNEHDIVTIYQLKNSLSRYE